MDDPSIKKHLMEERIENAIRDFETETHLTITEVRLDKRFNKDKPINVYTKAELMGWQLKPLKEGD